MANEHASPEVIQVIKEHSDYLSHLIQSLLKDDYSHSDSVNSKLDLMLKPENFDIPSNLAFLAGMYLGNREKQQSVKIVNELSSIAEQLNELGQILMKQLYTAPTNPELNITEHTLDEFVRLKDVFNELAESTRNKYIQYCANL